MLTLLVLLLLAARRRSPRHDALGPTMLRPLVVAWVRVAYRFRAAGLDRLPTAGPAVLACNHVSFVDALVIGAASPRPVRFVMDHRIHGHPALRWFFRTMRTIPIAPRREDPETFASAFDEIDRALQAGEVLAIFPEGAITRTGAMAPFRRGIEQIVSRTPVPVIPMALRGLWGSIFSRRGGPALRKLPRRFRARVELRCGEPMAPGHFSVSALQREVAALLELPAATPRTASPRGSPRPTEPRDPPPRSDPRAR